MHARKHFPKQSAGGEAGDFAQDKRLRALFATADPAEAPSEKLRQRVAMLATRRVGANAAVSPARKVASAWYLLRAVGRPAVTAAVIVLLLSAVYTITLRFDRPGRHHPVAEVAQRAPAGRTDLLPRPSPGPGRTDHDLGRGARRLPPSPATTAGVRAGGRPPSMRLTKQARGRLSPRPGQPVSSPVSGDLAVLNGASGAFELRPPVSRDECERIEERLRRTIQARDDFVTIPFPRLAVNADPPVAAAVESYRREAAVVDPRLSREVTLAFKATALSDWCDQVRADTGIELEAGSSVADEKVTVLCEKRPLREVMRQLARPFGYTWLRSGKAGAYRYELVQDLRSQLLEEELRNRDRTEALLALDREMERYRPYLALSPDEALARARSAPAVEKKLLENLAGRGWGAIQMYFRLSPRDLETLRAGRSLDFAQEPPPRREDLPLPPEIARGVLQSMRDVRIRADRGSDGGATIDQAERVPDGLPPAAFPEAQARVHLRFGHSELGQFTFDGRSGVFVGPRITIGGASYATGTSAAVRAPQNAAAHTAEARDPALKIRVTVKTQPSCRPTPDATGAPREPRATSADVLEALHRATGLPIAADSYTRLFPLAAVSLPDTPLFEALNRLADTMRLRWNQDKDGGWLQFRSVSYYDDRLKEVPNRQLLRWAASRREKGALTLDDLIEIAQLTDVQLNSPTMAEGARDCFDLEEWDLVRGGDVRPQLRYLATLTPAQRQAALKTAGLPFSQLSLAQQQQLIAHLGTRFHSLDELTGATIRVEYDVPGEFRWVLPELPRGQIRDAQSAALERLRGGMFDLSPIQARTREAALQAARGIDPAIDAAQIVPARLSLAVVYLLTDAKSGALRPLGVRGFIGSARISW